MKLALLVAATAAAFASTSVNANLITNGSFESPLVPGSSFTGFPVGTGTLSGWSVVGPSGEAVFIVSGTFQQNGVTFGAQDGAQWLDLTGFNNNSTEGVSQSVATTSGHQYQLSYFVGNTTGGGIFGSTSTVNVSVNGTPAYSDTNGTPSATTQNWEQFVHTFTATSSLTTLSFFNGDPGGDNSNGLDNVVLLDQGTIAVAAPEPISIGILFGGIVGLGCARYRRRT